MIKNNNNTNKNKFARKLNVINFAIGTILSQGCPDRGRLNCTAWLQIFVDPPVSRHPLGIWNFDVASKFLEKINKLFPELLLYVLKVLLVT